MTNMLAVYAYLKNHFAIELGFYRVWLPQGHSDPLCSSYVIFQPLDRFRRTVRMVSMIWSLMILAYSAAIAVIFVVAVIHVTFLHVYLSVSTCVWECIRQAVFHQTAAKFENLFALKSYPSIWTQVYDKYLPNLVNSVCTATYETLSRKIRSVTHSSDLELG